MTAFFKAGAFNTEKHGLSWHQGEAMEREGSVPQKRSLRCTDTVTTAMVAGNMLDIIPLRAKTLYEIDTGKYEGFYMGDNETLVLAGVPWLESGVQELRTVSRYQALSNQQIATILDPLSEEWEVAGVLHAGAKGEVVAVQLELEPFMVGDYSDEAHLTFLLVSENRLTGHKHYGITTVRVVCMNTYNAAITTMGQLPNTGEPELVLRYRTRLMQDTIKHRLTIKENLEKLMLMPVEKEVALDLVEDLFTMRGKTPLVHLYESLESGDLSREALYIRERGALAQERLEKSFDKVIAHRMGVIQAFNDFNDEFSYAANTAYGLWQAITYHVNHSPLYHATTDSRDYQVLFGGSRAKLMDKAWELLSKLR